MHETRAQRVLVIDDHDLVRNLVVTILEKDGFDVVAASSGHEALEIYQRDMDDIACVLLDLSMPRMSGPEVLRALKALDTNVKVILMSAHDESTGTAFIRDAGALGYLRKPFKPRALTDAVTDAIG